MINAYVQVTAAFVAVAIGILAGFRRKTSTASQSLGAGMLVLAIEAWLRYAAARSTSAELVVEWQRWGLMSTACVPAAWSLFSLCRARAGALQRNLRNAAIVACCLPPAVALLWRRELVALAPAPDVSDVWALRLGIPGQLIQVAVLIAAVAVISNLERTYRTAVGTNLWRIKSLLLGVGLVFLVRIYTSSQALLFRNLSPALEMVDAGALLLTSPLIVRSMLRPGGIEVSIYPSQAVIRGSLSIFLVGAYLFIVGVLARLVGVMGGDSAFPLKAILVLAATVGLGLILQSDRVRMQFRGAVSRHFRRPLHDAQSAWRRFSAATAAADTEDALAESAVRLVSDTFESLSVSLWLVAADHSTLRLTASTSLDRTSTPQIDLRASEGAALLSYIDALDGPLDLENRVEGWTGKLRDANPPQFPHGGRRLLVPVARRNECVGCLILGDRVAGAPFTLQDHDLLASIAQHLAASLLNIRLSERLGVARQFEGFQAMATFLVHDLKNAASSLKLTLGNLPMHWDDPEFRADASRGLARSIERLESLTERLGHLRAESTLQIVDADFDGVVRDAVAAIHSPIGVMIEVHLGAGRRLRLDRAQFEKVITNLVLNAVEAISPPGRIEVTTSATPDAVTLAVTDTGAGISAEFVRDGLFKPFRTTKRAGMGIGLFQSRMIVEAHGGSIGVETEHPRGTTFRIWLPTQPSSPAAEERRPALEPAAMLRG